MRDEHAGLRGGRAGQGPRPQVRRRGAGHVLARIPHRILLPFALDVSSLVSVCLAHGITPTVSFFYLVVMIEQSLLLACVMNGWSRFKRARIKPIVSLQVCNPI